MKKFLCLVLALGLALSFAACTGSWNSSVSDYSGEVSSNGGFAVVKGDYVYFINGVGDNTDDNTFGTPVKGALVRVKVSDLANDSPACEVVIPKIFYSTADEGSNGFYIYGDYVYYTSPNTDKDKTGTVQNTKLDFLRTRLDGTDTTKITTVSALTTPFRYVESGDTVYLVMYTTDSDSNNVLVSYDATKSDTLLATSGTVQNYAFSDDIAKAYCYYVEYAHDDVLDEDESFQNIVRFNFNGDEQVTKLEGNDGTQGATFSIIKDAGADLYYSKTYVDTTVTTTVKYYCAENDDFSDSALKLLSESTTNASTVFASTSYYKSVNEIIYFDSSLGFLMYDYDNKDDTATYGVTYLVKDKQVLSELSDLSVAFYKDDYVYMTDSSTYYYRVGITALLEGNCTVERITYVSLTTDSTFYQPEIIGDYIIAAVSTDPFYDYIYAVQIKTGLTDDEVTSEEDTYDFTVEENVTAFANRRIGVMTDDDQTSYDEYMEDTFADDD